MKFIEENFFALLFAVLFMASFGLVIHLIHRGGDASAVQWGETIVAQLLSALGVLATQNRKSQRTGDGPQPPNGGNGDAPKP